MARDRLHRILHRGLEVSGLIGPLHRAAERRLARIPGAPFDDGRPMPPPELMVVVSGTAGQEWFSQRGQADAAKFARLAAAHGVAIGGGVDVLDFGCGCGRIARWLAPEVAAHGGRFHGSDLNGKLVDWCARNLPGRYIENRLRPPLALAAASVDLVYAYSVLTHLREDAARAWLAEIARVLRPGGLALLTFHDEDYARAWGPPEVPPELARKPYIVWNDALEGSNYMSSWTTRDHFAALAGPMFQVLEITPGGLDVPEQAVAALRPRG